MNNPFDQFAKRIGKEALDPVGRTETQFEISPRGARHADLFHDPAPERRAERARLGLLGRLTAKPCLIEIYAHAPSADELRACTIKHLLHWQERRAATAGRKRRAKRPRSPPPAELRLWIIATTISAPTLRELHATHAPSYPTGVYLQGGKVYRTGLVVASKLPRTRATLLVRLMAAGPGLGAAIDELSALPDGAVERTVAEDIVLSLRDVLMKNPSRTPREEEIIMRVQRGAWARMERRLRTEGRRESAAKALLTVLTVRHLTVSDEDRERILAEKNMRRLERWHRKAIKAPTVAAVLGDPR